MPIHVSRMGIREQVFTHKAEDGTLRHFAADRLFRYCVGTGHEIVLVEIEPGYNMVIREKRGIEQHRLDRLTDDMLLLPVLYAMDVTPGTGLLIDGHHRYVRVAERGDTVIPAFVTQPKLWSRFLVEGIPDHYGEKQLHGFSGIR